MSNQQQVMLQALEDLQNTTDILLGGLAASDDEKSLEAISVMLVQGMNHFGGESPAMQQFFPVWDAIKSHIDRSDFERALSQTTTWQNQLRELIETVKAG